MNELRDHLTNFKTLCSDIIQDNMLDGSRINQIENHLKIIRNLIDDEAESLISYHVVHKLTKFFIGEPMHELVDHSVDNRITETTLVFLNKIISICHDVLSTIPTVEELNDLALAAAKLWDLDHGRLRPVCRKFSRSY
jgi:hypothetical protein